ncbi:MAG: hypothetical protein GXY52_00020 [Chloroflexi bacterium]|nr:hypothetical protein [Chloroflexota bacterium]
MESTQRSELYTNHSSSLDATALQALREIGQVDIVIGIPSHRNGRTIGEVLRAVAKGVATHLPNYRVLLINADGGSSDNTTHLVSEAAMPSNLTKLITTYVGPIGKGNAIRAIFEAAALARARACLVLEARVPGIKPVWIPKLVQPILDGVDLVIGTFETTPYASAFTDNVVYPFIRAFVNASLRNPLPSEFCIAVPVAERMVRQDIWETDISRFGINLWVALDALIDRLRIQQVELGARGEPSGDPGALGDLRLLHTISTLFRYLTTYHRLWIGHITPQTVLQIPSDTVAPSQTCSDCLPALRASFTEGLQQFEAEWAKVLPPRDIVTLRQLADADDSAFHYSLDMWVRTVLRFAFIYNCGEGDPDKVAEAFLPLYYARAATYIRDVLPMTPEERESEVEKIAQAMIDAKPTLAALWRERPFWLDPSWF